MVARLGVWLAVALAFGCRVESRPVDDGGGDRDLGGAYDVAMALDDAHDAAAAPADGGNDAASDGSAPADATVAASDGGATTPALGAAALRQRIYATNPATGTLTTSAVTTQAGSLLLASAARGTWSAAPDAPTDSFGNSYTLVGTTHAYDAWPTSATGLYRVLGAAGGAGHTFSLTWGDIGSTGDEISLSVVEVRGATAIDATSFVERAAAGTITSATVTTTGPARLVAWWWGSGGVRPVGTSHVAVPSDGFAIVPSATGLVSLSGNGYIQVAVATGTVDAAGTYSVTWTTDDEGAQLYLVALR